MLHRVCEYFTSIHWDSCTVTDLGRQRDKSPLPSVQFFFFFMIFSAKFMPNNRLVRPLPGGWRPLWKLWSCHCSIQRATIVSAERMWYFTHRIRRTPWPRAPWWFSPLDRRRTCHGMSGSRRSRWCSTVQPGTAHTCLRSECNRTDILRNQHINQIFQTIQYNSLFVAHQNAPTTSIDTEVILSS